MNNASGIDTTFEVWAVCAKPRSHCAQEQSGAVSVPAGTISSGLESCPLNTKILGGGAISDSFELTSNINSSYPTNNGWYAAVTNSGGTTHTFTVIAICSAYSVTAHYGVHRGTTVDNPAGSQTSATVSCPRGQSPLGGGAATDSLSTSVNLNTAEPT